MFWKSLKNSRKRMQTYNVAQLENMRKNAYKWHIFKIFLIICGCIFTVPFGFFIFELILKDNWDLILFFGLNPYLIGFLSIIGLALSYRGKHIANVKIKNFKLSFKNAFLSGILNEFFDDVTYNISDTINPKIVKSTKMLNDFDIYSGSDLVTGTQKARKDVRFRCSDLKIQVDGGDNPNETIFWGKWMIFEIDKPVYSINGWVKIGYGGGVSATTNNDEFNKKFKIASSSDNAAVSILTPRCIEAIMRLDKTVKGQIGLGFFNNELHISIHYGRNFNEPKLTRKINENITIIQNEFAAITHFIDQYYLIENTNNK